MRMLLGAVLAGLMAGSGTLPDHGLTPGLARPLTLKQVCGTAWGKDRRFVTLAMKKQVFQSYGIPWADHAKYEVDHLISRELAGADDVRNLWPQPYEGAWNAHMKDRLENRLHVEVCAGRLTLSEAQAAISGDWTAAYQQYFGTDK